MRTRHRVLTVLTGLVIGLQIGRAGQAVPAQTQPPLTPQQTTSIQGILKRTAAQAAPLGVKIEAAARRLNENVLSDSPDEAVSTAATTEISTSLASAVTLPIKAVKEIAALLTPEQRKFLRAEMAKPGAEANLLELIGRVYKLGDTQ